MDLGSSICRIKKCRGKMEYGRALEESLEASEDFIGDPPGRGCTFSPSGNSILVRVLKCRKCGHSFKIN